MNQEKVREFFDYKDGCLYVKKRYCDKMPVGSKVGTKNKDGYLQVTIMKQKHYIHRLVFLYHHGFLPESVDHVNNDKLDNKIQNLREATLGENNHNIGMNKRNTSGSKGVSWHKKNKKWVVTVRNNKKSMYFGSFEDIELAELVAIEARNKHHKEFANHG